MLADVVLNQEAFYSRDDTKQSFEEGLQRTLEVGVQMRVIEMISGRGYFGKYWFWQ